MDSYLLYLTDIPNSLDQLKKGGVNGNALQYSPNYA